MTINRAPAVGAIDIGYGNLKIFAPNRNEPELIPAVVAEADDIDLGAGVLRQRNTIRVLVGDREWEVGEGAHVLVSGSPVAKVRHAGYIETDEYRALLHAGLYRMQASVIDVLVTGLPVDLYRDQRQKLEQRLVGKHQITKDMAVEVRAAHVVPQPLGGFLDFVRQAGLSTAAHEMTILVIDPGYYSFDWMLFENMKPVAKRSGGNSIGFARVLDTIEQEMAAKFKGARPARAKLETAIREGKEHLYVGEVKVALAPYLQHAAQKVAPDAVKHMRNVLDRAEDINKIVVIGGPAQHYREPVKAVFPNRTISVLPEPVFSNVRGYKGYGESIAQKRRTSMAGA